jgi:hypothetical protein
MAAGVAQFAGCDVAVIVNLEPCGTAARPAQWPSTSYLNTIMSRIRIPFSYSGGRM